jgi:hypothetical protein
MTLRHTVPENQPTVEKPDAFAFHSPFLQSEKFSILSRPADFSRQVVRLFKEKSLNTFNSQLLPSVFQAHRLLSVGITGFSKVSRLNRQIFARNIFKTRAVTLPNMTTRPILIVHSRREI